MATGCLTPATDFTVAELTVMSLRAHDTRIWAEIPGGQVGPLPVAENFVHAFLMRMMITVLVFTEY